MQFVFQGDKFHEDKASITTLKRMTSSLGIPRIQPRIVLGGPQADMAAAIQHQRSQYDPTVGGMSNLRYHIELNFLG